MRTRMIVIALTCGLLSLLAARTGNAGTGPFRYRHVAHLGSAVKPTGLALDQQCGEIYISDEGAKVIHRFDQFGKLIGNIGTPGSEARGGISQPRGLFLANSVVQPLNALGPPTPCTGTGVLWATDYDLGRVDTFDPSGNVKSVWCGKQFPKGVCDVTGTTDYFPNDVWVTDERVWIAGRFSNTIREHDFSGSLVRSVGTGDATSVAQWGTSLWATHGGNGSDILGLYSADPTVGKAIPLVHLWPWKLDGPTEDVRGVTTGIDGTLYMIDRRGLEIFSPSGQPRGVIKLSDSYRPTDIAVRYDGTVYIVGEFTHGVEVFSPGATVKLAKLPGAKHEIVLGGSVTPASARDKVVIQRSEGNGWHALATVRLDAHLKFVYHWTPPQAKVPYQVRLFFHDTHPYYADRTSAVLSVASA
jgi:hypothetical protein